MGYASLFMVILSLTLPDTLHHRVVLNTSALTFEEIRGFDCISVDGALAIGKVGSPSLPRIPLYFAIPAGSTVGSVSGNVVGDAVELDGEFSIWPSQQPVPISWGDSIPEAAPDSTIYGLQTFWPSTVCQATDVGWLNGIRIARVDVFPLVWNPSSNCLKLRSIIDIQLQVVADTTPVPDAPVMSQTAWRKKISEVTRLLVNPEDISSYAVSPTIIPEDSLDGSDVPEVIDCIIVTKEDWVSAWQPLADWNIQRGLYTEILSIEQIEDDAGSTWDQGRDWAETVRNCLRWFYENKGIQYVLIGIDSRQRDQETIPIEPFDVPSRFCSAYFSPGSELIFQNTDWYYACLDEHLSWNTNADQENWGQYDPDDFAGNDLMDLLPEISLGRIPAHSYEEAEEAAARIVDYAHGLPSGSTPDLEILICSASAQGEGFPDTWKRMIDIFEDIPDSFSDTLWLAESSCDVEYWEPISVESVLNYLGGGTQGGAYRVDFGGHGGAYWLAANPEGGGPGSGNEFKILTSQLRSLSDDDGLFCTAWAFNCNTGDYAFSGAEGTVCETWVGCDGQSGNALLGPCYVGNVHFGLNSTNPEGSPSHLLNRWFNDALYNHQPVSGSWGAGDVFIDAKLVYALAYTQGYPDVIPPPVGISPGQEVEPMWDLKGTNLIADPACPIWLTSPLLLDVQHPTLFSCPGDFEVEVTDADEVPVEGARVCLMLKIGGSYEIYIRGFTDANGLFEVRLRPNVGGWLQVTVTKQNYSPHESQARLVV